MVGGASGDCPLRRSPGGLGRGSQADLWRLRPEQAAPLVVLVGVVGDEGVGWLGVGSLAGAAEEEDVAVGVLEFEAAQAVGSVFEGFGEGDAAR